MQPSSNLPCSITGASARPKRSPQPGVYAGRSIAAIQCQPTRDILQRRWLATRERMGRMTVRLTDNEIEKLEREGRIVGCVAVVCRVCGFRQHDSPNSIRPAHEACPKGCVLPTLEGQCRLCGESRISGLRKPVCNTHYGGPYYRNDSGCYPTEIAETHWHAAEGTGPVSQYAVTR